MNFSEQIETLEERIEERAASLEATQLLMSIPGVSHYSALLLYAEIGEIDRFDRDKESVSYAGLVPVVRESPDSRLKGTSPKRDQDSYAGFSSSVRRSGFTTVTMSTSVGSITG